MGLIKASTGAIGGTLADQWKEFFSCDSLPNDVIVTKGVKQTSNRSSNTHGSTNVISSGSIFVVASGQCAIVVEQGKVIDVCSEPGAYEFKSDLEPTIFGDDLDADMGTMIKDSFRKRFQYGGEISTDQRIYYVNTKEFTGNKYGTPSPIPFRVTDKNIGLDMDVSIRCFGEYSYRVSNPILFYENVCGNIEEPFCRDSIDSQLKSELLTVLQPAMATLSAKGIRYSDLPSYTNEIADALNGALSEKWNQLRGIRVASVAISGIKADAADEAMIKELQRNAVFRDPTMAAAHLVGAQSDAMQAAANNEKAGAAAAFIGMGMAQAAGGFDAQALFNLGMSQRQASEDDAIWTCRCGAENSGNFCSNCGERKPILNQGAQCSECGWISEDGSTVRFCPNCGNKLL